MFEAHVQDPYQQRGKPPEPCACPDCGAICHKGCWQWGEAAADAQHLRCPACSRIHDHVPAGVLTIQGDFGVTHREEILRLVRHQEEKERAEHALERIMDIEEGEDQLTIHFTGVHLPRGVGEALKHAYQGELTIHHNQRDGQIRVSWQRAV
ncbi:MAG: hypothetical protein FD130_438 [Halothiobacillaceae bacterium]|nr:MAG: hypothetical protein FD130_438 [Halothiobacillaceae bacterium]